LRWREQKKELLMKTSLTMVALALAASGLGACGSAQRGGPAPADPSMTGNPVCLTGGLVPADESMVDYGTTYTPDTDGPAASTTTRHVAKCADVKAGR
jgi:hypothetical protein